MVYLTGVEQTAQQATRTAGNLLTLFTTDRERVMGLGRSAGSAARVFELLRQRVILSPTRAAEVLGLSTPTVAAALGRLVGLGVARERTGRAYGRQYVYEQQLEILDRTDVAPAVVPAPRSAFE